jgi:hypothetical protein
MDRCDPLASGFAGCEGFLGGRRGLRAKPAPSEPVSVPCSWDLLCLPLLLPLAMLRGRYPDLHAMHVANYVGREHRLRDEWYRSIAPGPT